MLPRAIRCAGILLADLQDQIGKSAFGCTDAVSVSTAVDAKSCCSGVQERKDSEELHSGKAVKGQILE